MILGRSEEIFRTAGKVPSYLSIPTVRRYLASLGAVRELDGALRFVEPNVHRYTAEELLAVAKALAKVAGREWAEKLGRYGTHGKRLIMSQFMICVFHLFSSCEEHRLFICGLS